MFYLKKGLLILSILFLLGLILGQLTNAGFLPAPPTAAENFRAAITTETQRRVALCRQLRGIRPHEVLATGEEESLRTCAETLYNPSR